MTYQILLNKEKAIALVSPEDFGYLSQFCWYLHQGRNTYYAFRKCSGRKVYMHREILLLQGKDPILVDHRDGNGLNNRRDNLRPGSPSLNALNRHVIQSNALGVPGIYERKGRYIARLCSKYLGSFGSLDEASLAYTTAKANLLDTLGANLENQNLR